MNRLSRLCVLLLVCSVVAGCGGTPAVVPTSTPTNQVAENLTPIPGPATNTPLVEASPATNPTPTAHHTPVPVVPPVAGDGPCAIKPIDVTDPAMSSGEFRAPPEVVSANGLVSTTLQITFTDAIDSPVPTIAGCPVSLRSYNGQLVGPTLRVKPGDTIRLTIENQLPDNGPNLAHHANINLPQNFAFNTTNLHTHGLHVSPVGNSDNVLLNIEPHENFEVEVKIPSDHPAGTYWYHPHAHGSTAVQVSSGMEGAIIIEGDQIPNTIDSVPQVAEAQEQIFVFQQIPYTPISVTNPLTGFIDVNNFGNIFGPCSWEPMMRPHTINGQVNPTLTMSPEEVQRWRLIHAGVRETLSIELRGPITSSTNNITDALQLPSVPLNEIAVDGISLGRVDTWNQVEINPGYRSDVLVKPIEPGTYYMVDGLSEKNALTCSNPGQPVFEDPSILATVVVTGSAKPMNLPTNADVAGTVPPALKPIVQLSTTLTQTQSITQGWDAPGLQTLPFTAAWYLAPQETIDGVQEVSLSVTAYSGVLEFTAGEQPFDHDHKRTLLLNNTEAWVLQTPVDSLASAHPFHIHVNPFQTWRVGPDNQPQLLWRDTLLITRGQPQYTYTRYQDYIGAFVYHCHILDHEDQGMMEMIEIVNP